MFDIFRLTFSYPFVLEPLHDGQMFPNWQMWTFAVNIIALFLQNDLFEGVKGRMSCADRVKMHFI